MICKYCIIKSINTYIKDNALLVEYPDVSTIDNKDCLVFKIEQDFSSLPNTLKVKFKINNSTFDIMTSSGNSVRANQIKAKKVYVVYVSTEFPIMIMKCYLPSSGLKYPSLSVKDARLVS